MALVIAWPLGTNMVTGCSLHPRHLSGFSGTVGHRHQGKPWLCRTMGSDMVLINSPGLDVILVPDGSIDFSAQHGPSGSMADCSMADCSKAVYSMAPGGGLDPWQWHGLQWYQEPQTSALSQATVKPLTQTWSSDAVSARMPP